MGRIAEKYDLKWSDIGEVIGEQRYIVKYHEQVVCDLPIRFLSEETPLCAWEKKPNSAERPFQQPQGDIKEIALKILSHPEIAHRDWVTEQYDHGVQVRTISIEHDAAVLRLEDAALVLSCGCNPRQIYLQPYAGTANAVYANAANLACLGAEPLCILDCLNFASPVHPEIFWQIEQAILGMGDMARGMDIPVVGGNVSLYNESDEFNTKIKPTPTIGMAGKGPVRRWKYPSDGCSLALVGATGPHFGGSILDAVTNCGGDAPPQADPKILPMIRERVAKDIFEGVTDLSQAGLLGALAGLAPNAEVTLVGDPVEMLFSETYGRFLVAYRDESALKDLTVTKIGTVGGHGLRISAGTKNFEITRADMENALSSLTKIMRPTA
jgi:phosphoribosylformylglycinamidine synthase